MRMDRLTVKSQEALRAAADLASRRGNPEVLPEHLLFAALSQDGGIAAPLVQKAGAQAAALAKAFDVMAAFDPAKLISSVGEVLSVAKGLQVSVATIGASVANHDIALAKAAKSVACNAR